VKDQTAALRIPAPTIWKLETRLIDDLTKIWKVLPSAQNATNSRVS